MDNNKEISKKQYPFFKKRSMLMRLFFLSINEKVPLITELCSHHLLKTFSANPGRSWKDTGFPSNRIDPEKSPKT